MTDVECKEQAFPQLFPSGEFRFMVKRDVKLPPKKYFVSRLLNQGPKFAQNVEYVFFAQNVCEHKQRKDNIFIPLIKAVLLQTPEGSGLTQG